jgi:hypothetical protein
MKTYPLAVYTADHGLAWSYLKSAIPFATLDACRKAFGQLPDFDANERGFDGVWVTGSLVFAMKCQSVRAWDFRGRDATYLAVTWLPRSEAADVDFEKLLHATPLCVPTKTPPMSFGADAGGSTSLSTRFQVGQTLEDFSCVGRIIADSSPEDLLLFKRSDGDPKVTTSAQRKEENMDRFLKDKLAERPAATVHAQSEPQAHTDREEGCATPHETVDVGGVGRARRLEYIPIAVICFLIASFCLGAANSVRAFIAGFVLVRLVMIIENARRLHDVGFSGWWQLVPCYMILVAFYRGQVGANKYGPNPRKRKEMR